MAGSSGTLDARSYDWTNNYSIMVQLKPEEAPSAQVIPSLVQLMTSTCLVCPAFQEGNTQKYARFLESLPPKPQTLTTSSKDPGTAVSCSTPATRNDLDHKGFQVEHKAF